LYYYSSRNIASQAELGLFSALTLHNTLLIASSMCAQTNISDNVNTDGQGGDAAAAASIPSSITEPSQTAAPVVEKGAVLVYFTICIIILDTITSTLFMSPVIPWIYHHEQQSNRYTFAGSLWDLLILSGARIALAGFAFVVSYFKGNVRIPYGYLELYHANGSKKTKDELEEEALEQSFLTWLRQYVHRAAFPCEFLSLLSTLLLVCKCLVRLNVEIGIEKDADPIHPLFWCALLVCSIHCVLEMTLVDTVCVRLGEWGHMQKQNNSSLLRQISSHLSIPLLANDGLQQSDAENDNNAADEEGQGHSRLSGDDENAPGVSDIGGDTDYKASWSDLLHLCAPDAALIVVAFMFLLLAAAAQICIPRFTGAILDALEEAYSKSNHRDVPVEDVPGFMSNVRKLIVVSILGGIFSGIRGSIFTVVGGRVNVRLRLRLMDALLCMEQGFFDVTKTGDITSRLSSDTTLVGDQVTLNVNVSSAKDDNESMSRQQDLTLSFFKVFLRSLVQVIGVLIFMFMVSWQLSILAFISVPIITVLSKWYGEFVRSLTKLMQSKLADGNGISEAAISSMPTVRAFDAATTEYREFKSYMDKVSASDGKCV
jgi:hypothetical protein